LTRSVFAGLIAGVVNLTAIVIGLVVAGLIALLVVNRSRSL
jgi:multisubunit Na+/H+ antiporter MnhC subunit